MTIRWVGTEQRWPSAVLGLFALVSCQGSAPTSATGPPDASVVAMSLVSGNAQSAPVSTNVAAPLRVRVLDRSGHPVPDFVVNFVVTSGGGSVFGGAEQTDTQGYAQDIWTLGPRLGPQTVDVRSVDAHTGRPITYGYFTATGLPPHIIPVVFGNGKGIARMNADGTGIEQLTTNPSDALPDLSPDHTKIAFVSARSGSGSAIYLMNANGSNIHPITGFVPLAGPPSFSPDGTRLVFLFSVFSGIWEQNVEVTDTSGTVIGGWLHPESIDVGVSWSADGQLIVYASDFVNIGFLDIYKSDIAGQNVVLLTDRHWCGSVTAESPDGRFIGFVGYPASPDGCPGAPTQVYLMDLNGDNITAITGNVVTTTLTWSPNSQLIGTDQGLMNADGTDLMKINGGAEGRFAWR